MHTGFLAIFAPVVAMQACERFMTPLMLTKLMSGYVPSLLWSDASIWYCVPSAAGGRGLSRANSATILLGNSGGDIHLCVCVYFFLRFQTTQER